ncbi:hypothetical protein SAMN05660461_5475 [Chitinophaga ginsengisegetis]|uniref:Uncharacterized protein n=2 Tax=Chitinophaga ginsengisegetis TaxID=393003 RepID=A0A1T5PA84_9BACT|nr:hypothetical protein SAMN05660461_5475 [Chitinophaga ginsengisegetis]
MQRTPSYLLTIYFTKLSEYFENTISLNNFDAESKCTDMNTIAYAIYLAITYLITVKVGWRFYRNGRVFILGLLEQNHTLADAINNILLVGYYLVNLGYATVMISTWDTIHDWTEMLVSITAMTGQIFLSLGILHCFNMLVIYIISKRNHSIQPLKS